MIIRDKELIISWNSFVQKHRDKIIFDGSYDVVCKIFIRCYIGAEITREDYNYIDSLMIEG